ncbi:MAG: hypothetical protein WDZ85_02730 [Candidatus Paceibacterota bacterium]
MPKNFVQDIVKKRSLKEVLPTRMNGGSTGRDSSQRPAEPESEEAEAPGTPIPSNMPNDNQSILKRRSRIPVILMWLIGLASLVFLFIIFSTVFARVTIEVTPKQGRIIMDNEEFTAARQAVSGQLEFGLVTDEVIESLTVPASGSEEVRRQASGQLTVFNDFDGNPQELVARTRFATPDGKIYRIDRPITVPGQRIVDGETVPGQVTATIYADEPGEDYNIGPTDFTIPGFEGSERYDGFSARSEGPMTGGFVGEIKSVNEEDEAAARETLRERLSTVTPPESVIPEDKILFSEAVFSHLESLPIADGDGSATEAKVSEKLVITGLLFDRRQLASFLATQFIPDYTGEPVEIANLDEISFSLVNKKDIDPLDIQTVDFVLDGNAHLVWVVETEEMKDALRGLNKSGLRTAIAPFPAVERLIPRFRPPWIQTIPDDTDKIKIKVVTGE